MAQRGKRQRSRWASVRLRAALSLGVVVSASVMGTHAYWTDSVSVLGATFSTGTLDLQVNNLDAAVDFSTISLAGMVPGNTTAGVLTVKNAGTVPLKYTATSAATNADGKGLGAALIAKVTGASATTGSGAARTCAGTTLTGTGTSLNGAIISTGRTLAVGGTETICVQVTLSATAPSALQAATTTATLTFTGTSDLS